VPSYFSYIGKLNSPGFYWNEIPPAANPGNTPARLIPKDSSSGLGFAPGIVSYWSKKAGLEGKQLDWVAWGLLVRKADLEAIWKEAKEQRWQDQKEWQKFWDEITALPDDEMYVLVVAENP
jgi:hypothetical protein